VPKRNTDLATLADGEVLVPGMLADGVSLQVQEWTGLDARRAASSDESCVVVVRNETDLL